MKQLLKNFNSSINTLHLKKSGILFFALLLFSISSSLANNGQAFYISQKDSSGIDSIQKTKAASLAADSSKIFSSLLLSPFNNKGLSFSMNAEAKFFAEDYIKRHTDYFNSMKVWGKPYFDLYDRILTSYDIPVQLKYLSVIESSLRSTAVSWAGAVGPWQIMSGTAREHGLKTGYYDERADYIKSTNAACKILKELYDDYGDWLLVIAAYNAGSGSVNRAISKAHSKNFWDLQYYLPLETRTHVKKFIATHYFFEGDGSVATATGNEIQGSIPGNDDAYLHTVANCLTVNLYGKYNSVVIANTLMMDINLFNQLNPDIDNALAKGDIYPLRIPSDKVQLFQSKKVDMLRQSVELLLSPSGK